MSVFRYTDRWQGPIRNRWGRPDQTEDLLALLERRDRQLEQFLETHTARSKWITPTMTNGWGDFGGGYASVAYRKVGDVVQLRGTISTGTLNTAAFTLPAGYRPVLAEQFATVSNGALGVLQVDANGVVTPVSASNVSFGLACQFSVST